MTARGLGSAPRARLVVTGRRADGRSGVVSEFHATPIRLAEMDVWRLWAAEGDLHVPLTSPPAASAAFFPPPGGHGFILMTIPPDSALPARRRALASPLSHASPRADGRAPGMHATDTVDFAVVLSGAVRLELDDGDVVDLAAGDALVQGGAWHRWSNPFAEEARIAVVLAGAARD